MTYQFKIPCVAAGIGAGYVYFPTISFLDSRSVWVGKRTFVFVFRRSLWRFFPYIRTG